MESILTTPRLKLTLITHAERGSAELNWLHELRSNKQTTAWRYTVSIHCLRKPLQTDQQN